MRRERRIVDGVLLLDKPSGMTSNAALQRARWLLSAKKAGHTGTLDPMATGLLPLTFGEATKFSQMLLEADKEYEATIALGQETDTGDADGQPIGPVGEVGVLSAERLRPILRQFVGDIEQVPPMYSALKRDGKPLYEYARAGIEIERAPRNVRVHALDLLEITDRTFTIVVRCSKGTYIRTLAIDLGRALGCGAHLSALRRTSIGPFTVATAVTLPRIESLAETERNGLLEPVDTLVGGFPSIALDDASCRAMLQGQTIRPVDPGAEPGPIRMYGAVGFIGLGMLTDQGELSPKRLIATG